MNLLNEIGNATKIGIAGHIRPDGDCISSCLGLKAYLQNAMPEAEITVYMEPNPPTIFAYLYGYSDMEMDYPEVEAHDVFITVDASSLDRLGKALKYFENAKKTICIDHHESNPGFAVVNENKPYASSTCEVLYGLFEKEYIDKNVAECLFSGMVHDSGVFQYSNMSKNSFYIVGELIEYGFDGPKIIQETFYQKSFAQNKILGRALLESELMLEGKCIVSLVDRKMMESYDVLPKHLEGIVNQLQNTRGVEVAVFVYEISENHYKISMRSNGKVNVAEIAVMFGGGGHAKAAGADVMGNYSDIIKNLTGKIAEKL